MLSQTGNLSNGERVISAIVDLGLSFLTTRRGAPLLRAATGAVGAALLARAAAGHCAVKATAAGHSTLREGLVDQWRRLQPRPATSKGLPGSPVHAHSSEAVDEAIIESFPASDPPASRVPDEPPVHAAAKWADENADSASPPSRK